MQSVFSCGSKGMMVEIHAKGRAAQVTAFSEALTIALHIEIQGADALPEWLRQEFTPPSTPEEKAKWLNKWRKESPQGQALMEKERGWDIPGWLYWISGKSGLWTVKSLVRRDDETLAICLDAADWPAPVAALEWLAEKAGVALDER
ncbi:hypothetical protein [Streptomyces sp. bgisy153]|uniref:hypothetical protein n=1 Tax=Streptomyces sp. bgisy153 TaxID=3413793 RepID=UPI003D723210